MMKIQQYLESFNMKKTEFKNVQIGDKFISNGYICQKVSSKTAVIIQNNSRYHLSQNEIVLVL